MAPFALQYRVPWADVDFAGVVYFLHFVGYFEKTEIEWVRSRGIGYGEFLAKMGIWLPRVSVHCNYHAPAHLDDLLSIEMKLERLGNTSFTLGYGVYRLPDRRFLADGYSVITAVSRSTFEPVRVPDELREMLQGLG